MQSRRPIIIVAVIMLLGMGVTVGSLIAARHSAGRRILDRDALIQRQRAAAGLPEGLTMHRVRAGSPGADGWYEARSTDGHFRVAMPIPFNDFTYRGEEDGRKVAAFSIGSKSDDGIKFVASEFPAEQRRDAEVALEDFATKMKRDLQGKILREEHFRYDGLPAVEIEYVGQKSSASMRMIVHPEQSFLLIVEYPPESAAEVGPLAQRFFNSLQQDGTGDGP